MGATNVGRKSNPSTLYWIALRAPPHTASAGRKIPAKHEPGMIGGSSAEVRIGMSGTKAAGERRHRHGPDSDLHARPPVGDPRQGAGRPDGRTPGLPVLLPRVGLPAPAAPPV